MTATGLSASRADVAAVLARLRRPLRDALIMVGLARAFVYFVVQGIHPWEFAGIDAKAYWGIDLAHPYLDSGVGEYSTYLYSPAFAQLMAPFSLLPFEAFFALWTAASFAILVWLVRPWPWAIPMLILPITYELFVGNVHYFLAAAFVVALRAPVAWAFPLLTKITPAVGGLWLIARAQWRAAALAAGSTLAIVAVSYLLSPTAWADWIAFLLASPGRTELLLPRLALAAALVVFGARTNRPWVIPVAGWLALPVIWINSWVILLAVIRLREPRWGAGPG
ncbi:MAG: glycosyltransferase family 87 protein [Chloroflexota bacterium]